MTEQALLHAALRGDHVAFRDLVAPHRNALYAHCRRMLRSPHDAEDAVQDTMLRAWRALATFTGQSPIRAWLYRIATNVCLSAIQRREHQASPADSEPDDLPLDEEEHDTPEDAYATREAAALATTVVLHQLPANQRAALILRDVLGFPAREAASTLGTTVASVNSALQRARANVDDCTAEPERAPHDDAVEGLIGALARGDVDVVIGIATEARPAEERSWSYSAVPAY